MEAIININGEIGDSSLIDVVSQFKKFDSPTSLTVNITSVGGYVEQGDAIYNYLKALNLPITTIAKQVCASIATKIFLAGDIRKVEKGTDFLIHNPFIDGISGDASQLDEASKEVKAIENSLNKFYADALNLPVEAIAPLTKNETFLNENQLISLGFATEILDSENTATNTYKAVAKINLKTNNMSDQKEVKSMLQELLDGFKVFAKGFKPKAMLELTDASGTMLVFPDLEPDQEVSVDDTVTAEDGSYTMPDGTVIEVAGGKVTAITPVSNDEPSELEAENAALRTELEELKASNKVKEEAMAKFEKQLEKVKAMVQDHNPDKDKREVTKPKAGFTYEKGKISNLKK